MLAVGPAMDSEFPQHEVPPAGSVLYSPPPLQGPLQVSLGSGVGLGWREPSAFTFLNHRPLGVFC